MRPNGRYLNRTVDSQSLHMSWICLKGNRIFTSLEPPPNAAQVHFMCSLNVSSGTFQNLWAKSCLGSQSLSWFARAEIFLELYQPTSSLQVRSLQIFTLTYHFKVEQSVNSLSENQWGHFILKPSVLKGSSIHHQWDITSKRWLDWTVAYLCPTKCRTIKYGQSLACLGILMLKTV